MVLTFNRTDTVSDSVLKLLYFAGNESRATSTCRLPLPGGNVGSWLFGESGLQKIFGETHSAQEKRETASLNPRLVNKP